MNKDIRTTENIIFYLKFTLDKKESKLKKLTNKFRTKKVNIKIEKLENEIVTLKYLLNFYIHHNTETSKQNTVKEESEFSDKVTAYEYIIKETINKLGCVSYDDLKQHIKDSIAPPLDDVLFLKIINSMVKDNSINCDNLNDLTESTFTSDKQLKEYENSHLKEKDRLEINIDIKSIVLSYINQNEITNIKDILNDLESINDISLEKDYILKILEELFKEKKIHTVNLLNSDTNKILYASNDYSIGHAENSVPMLELIERLSK